MTNHLIFKLVKNYNLKKNKYNFEENRTLSKKKQATKIIF